MKRLFDGLHRFRTDVFSADRELFQKLAGGQSPEVLFITCSDSRVVPTLMTQSAPGELFVIRNAGNMVPAFGAPDISEGATIEYAVTALGIRDVVICGHTACGAMAAILDPGSLAQMPLMRNWLELAETTRRILRENFPDHKGEERALAAVQVNVLVQLSNLKTHPSIAARLARGDIVLHGWVYDLAKGEVQIYDPERGQWVGLDEAPEQPRMPSPLTGAKAPTDP